ncbi:MAG: hypothetical protein IT303_08170 [Dehalococcoidia bacterium]|nr:hypothetical protein [Dehalococcoidia bacterium]
MGEITVEWPAQENEHGGRLLWFGSWLVGESGAEGEWFYTGRGGVRETYRVPPVASGVRIRRWPNEGLDAEYADVVGLGGLARLCPERLDFDVRQRFSRLPVDFE